MKILNEIFKKLEKEVEFSENERWVLGFSGGPDSVFLLEALLNFREKTGIKLEFVLAHINHLLRGEDSEADEKFCREIAEKYNLRLLVKRANIEEIAKNKKIGLEEAGREIRHEFFKEIKEKENCRRIALAHNKDDQIETFLFRLIRGTSLAGLEGIAYSKDDYIRPVADVYKSEIMRFLDENNIPYRIDKSNFESDFTRNSIRLELIPFIEERYNPKFKDKIYNLIGEIRDVNEETSVDFERYLDEQKKISIEDLKILSDFSKKKVLAGYINSFGYSCDRYKLEKIVELLEIGGTKKISLAKNIFIIKDYRYIYIENVEKKNLENKGKQEFETKEEVTLKIPGKIVFGDYEIEAKINGNQDKKVEGINTILTNLRKDDTLEIRYRREGDRMIPLGMNSEKKLKDIMINEKVPQKLRNSIPIFTFKEEIFWIGGIKFSEKYLKKKGDNQWTELILRRIETC